MATIPWEELNKPRQLRKAKYRGKVFTPPRLAEGPPILRPVRIAPASKPAVDANVIRQPELRTAKRTLLPEAEAPRESKRASGNDHSPVVNVKVASSFLGVSVELLKKWRQRSKGPDYIQYGPGGPVCYEFKALLELRDHYKVRLNLRHP
jgi:hypothetical protein